VQLLLQTELCANATRKQLLKLWVCPAAALHASQQCTAVELLAQTV
jgi:hypothetical protein